MNATDIIKKVKNENTPITVWYGTRTNWNENEIDTCRKLEWVDCHRADEQGGIAGLTMVAGDKYDGDHFGEKLFILMYERLYSTELPDLREDINRVDELEKIAILLEYEYTCWLNGEADVYFYVKE